MKLSDYVVQTIYEKTGCKHVFTLTGGMAMHLIESFGSYADMTVVPTHHEQAAGIAASSYARVKGVPGVVLVTAGPGALNAVTPCAGAYMESIPMVFISGQVSTANSTQNHPVRQRGIQEANIVEVVKSITKYAVKVTDPQTIKLHLEKGLSLAVSGRPGPVWLDIPVDIQAANIEPNALDGYVAETEKQNNVLPQKLEAVMQDFLHASRPLLILGGGIHLAGASNLSEQLIDTLNVPFQTSWNGMDLVDNSHPLFFGRANVFGTRYANILIQESDFILAVGCRFGIQHTGYNVQAFAPKARIAMVDIDENEMTKPGLNITDRIVMDARDFISWVLSRDKKFVRLDISKWVDSCKKVKALFPVAPFLEQVKDDKYVQPQFFVNTLAQLMPQNAIFPFGASGMGHTVTGSIFHCKKGQRVFTFKGLAAMGYGLPCAVGAAIAAPNRPVFTLIGEGGLQLNIQELETAKTQALPIKIIVFNNGGYHSIHMTQKGYFNKHFVGSGPESGVDFPSLPGVAQLYDMDYFSVSDNKQVEEKVKKLIDNKKSAFLEVFVDPTKPLEPKLASKKMEDGTMVSGALDEMLPVVIDSIFGNHSNDF